MKFDSLVGAKIRLTLRRKVEEEEEEAGDAMDFLQGICNVKNLFLRSETLQVLTFCSEKIPVFKNLSLLEIHSDPNLGWESLPALLGKCPVLETLVFKGVFHRAADTCGDVCVRNGLQKLHSCLSTSPVKVYECGEADEEDEGNEKTFTEQIRHLLKTMPNLEEAIVYCQTSALEVAKEVQKMSKAPKCKTQVVQY